MVMNFTDLIATLSAERSTGRLDIVAGGNKGALLFNGGKLVDARIGHLTGFQAVNALASMRDARFHFDPSIPVPPVSSINPSERRVLKQFFGVETADAYDHAAPVFVEEVDEPTLVKSRLTAEPTGPTVAGPTVIEEPADTAAVYQARPKVRYVAALALVVLLVAIAGAAVFLREKYQERTSAAPVATSTEPVATTEEPVASEQPVVKQEPEVEEELVSKEEPVNKEEPRVADANDTPASTTPDLSGDWTVINTVNTTSHRSFQNLRIGFALSINQTGATFTAKGTKVSENGRRLPADSRTPIEIHGVINGDRIEATFSEQGSRRNTNGRFVWKIDRARGELIGTFASTAARTSGKSTATREL